MNYQEFINQKSIFKTAESGIDSWTIGSELYDFQSAIVAWALQRGSAAVFADCGLGKTVIQLEWARNIPGRVLIVAPLAVSKQTVREGARFGIEVKYLREDDRITPIVITNYEMLEHFNPDDFTGIVLDESSILKSYTGKFRNYIIEHWGKVRYKLCATATPAPNDFMELGSHAEFLGVMTRSVMLATFFIHDAGETQTWRLKGHAEGEFWRWMCSWSIMLRNPSDIGFDGSKFILPPLEIHDEIVEDSTITQEFLFALPASTLQERQSARRRTSKARCEKAASIIETKPKEQWLVWCDLNIESDTIRKIVPGCIEIKGSDDIEWKENSVLAFADGQIQRLVSKASITGFGVNWQACHNMIFVGLSDSYEQYYQALRRCWRFGQLSTVHAHIVTSSTEGAVTSNIRRKEADADRMFAQMVAHMSDITKSVLHNQKISAKYSPNKSIEMPAFL